MEREMIFEMSCCRSERIQVHVRRQCVGATAMAVDKLYMMATSCFNWRYNFRCSVLI